jgi:hypothetical protein
VTLRRSQRLLAVVTPEFEFTTQLIAGPFPDYQRVIPAVSGNSAACDRAELLAALARLEAVSTADAALVALVFGGAAHVDVYLARQPDDGRDAIDAEVTGVAMTALSSSGTCSASSPAAACASRQATSSRW